MGSANHSPDLSAKLKTSQDTLDKDALQRGKNFPNYYTNAYHVQKDEKKESWTHLGPDLNQEHPVVTTPLHPILRYLILYYHILSYSYIPCTICYYIIV